MLPYQEASRQRVAGARPKSRAFRDFQNDQTVGKMVLKYNPVVVNSGGIIITKLDVDCQFNSYALVAQVAGVAPPTQAAEDQFIRSLPSRFGSTPKEQQEYFEARGRASGQLVLEVQTTIQMRAAIIADIRRNVHSSADVSREARQAENDSGGAGKYWHSYEHEMTGAILDARRVIGNQIQMQYKFPFDEHELH